MGEDVLVQAGDEVQLSGTEREARLLQLNGDGHLAGASVHRKVGNLEKNFNIFSLYLNEETRETVTASQMRLTRGIGLAVRMPKVRVVSSGG